MKNFFEKLDKILQKARRKEKVKVENRVGLLHKLIRMVQGREIVLTLVWPWGGREKLKIAQRGIFLWDENKCMWDEQIDLSHGDKEEDIRKLADNSKSVCGILMRALEDEVEIEIT